MAKFSIFIVSLFFLNFSFSQNIIQEDFEIWPPSNWEIYELGDALDGWIQDWQGVSYANDHSAYSGIDNSHCDNWMVSPQVNIENDSYELRFWEISSDIIYYDKASIWISTGSSDPNDGEFILLSESLKNEEVWEEQVIDLSTYSGQTITVAFRYEGTWHNWFVDKVSIAPVLFVDGTLTQILNPSGVSTVSTVEDVIVTLRNTGNLTIENADIEWMVNNVSQETFIGTSLNLQPEMSVDINLGNYSFEFDNAYEIVANLKLDNDFESSNNTIEGEFEVTIPRDGLVVGVNPEGMIPNTGFQDVSVVIKNVGQNTIDSVNVVWSVNEVEQTSFSSNSVGIEPGESRELIIGQFEFQSGLHEIEAEINVFGDSNNANDKYVSNVPIAIFWESFEGRIFPPENWSIVQGVLDDINFDFPVHGEKYYTSVPEWNIFYNISDTLFTPLLDIEQGDKFNFYLKGSNFFADNTSLVWKDGITGEIHHIQEILSPTNSWEYHAIDISAATGTNYIGIINGVSGQGGNGQSKFDLFTSDASLHVAENDIAITNGNIYFLAKQNISESFSCRVKNFGSKKIEGSDYRVKLMEESGIEIASAQGKTLNSWEETEIVINHTFSAIDQHRLNFEVEYLLDENPANNNYRATSVNVVPNTIILNSIGEEDGAWSGLPFNASPNVQTLGEDDLSQGLYYSDEFETVGNIYGIIYNYDNLFVNNTIQKLPLKVWVGQTDAQDLSNGWIGGDELELVFDDTLEVLPGFDKQMFIPFDTPIQFTGIDNFVIQHFQYDPEYPASLLRFENNFQTEGPIRSIQASDVYSIDPNNPPPDNAYYLTQSFCYATMVIDPSVEEGLVTGYVYNLEGEPLINATISVEGTSISTSSDNNGEYVLPSLPYGNYEIVSEKYGYFQEVRNVAVDSDSLELDFYLPERKKVNVIGQVVGSNDLGLPLSLVDIKIKGYIEKDTNSDNNGEFIFSEIFEDDKVYEISFFLYGYREKILQVVVSDLLVDLGTIVLDQEFLSPFDVKVEKNNGVVVSWEDALESEKIKIQYDFGYDSNAYANEPNEEVWLGNIFSISEITTLESVEIETFYIESTTDFVSIDVIDMASNEILASSEPFLIHSDTILIVDIPNIVVYEDIAVMVHWKDNPSTTNFLNIDFSDISIPNAAAIRYPGESVQLLSDFFGSEQNQSFHVRLNTIDNGNQNTNNEDLTYNVLRGMASEFPNIDNWDVLNADPINSTTFEDIELSSIDSNNIYRYAVETIYSEGLSEVTFSNEITYDAVKVDDLSGLANALHVYPVPTAKTLNVQINSKLNQNSSIVITDNQGRRIANIPFTDFRSGFITIDVSQYVNDVYYLVLTSQEGTLSRKFVIKRF